MDSLIEAAERNFEAKTPISTKTKLAMKVLKLYLFNKVMSFDKQTSPEQSLMIYLGETIKQIKSLQVNEGPLLTNLLSVFYLENALRPANNVAVVSDFIEVALNLKMNTDVKKLIEIGMNSHFIIIEDSSNEDIVAQKSAFFDLCSYAFNMTRNIDKAVSLLRKVEQREDVDFSISLFNNVIECCLKSKQEQVAESLLDEYTENVDTEIRHNPLIVCTLITGYSKLNKIDEAYEIYTQEFNVQKSVGTKKYLTSFALNALLEGCVRKGYTNDIESIFKYHSQEKGIVDISTISIMIKGYCKNKQMDKALELCNSLDNYNVEPDTMLFEYFLEGCAKNAAIDMAFDIFDIMQAKKIVVGSVSYNSIIEACIYSNNLDKGWKVLEIMESHGVSPDRYSYCFLFKGIKGPHHKRHLTKALNLIFESENSSEDNSQLSYQHYCNNVLLNACINCGEMEQALRLLERMNKNATDEKPDEVSYNTIIKGCAKTKQLDTAFKIFNNMIENGVKPNDVTYNSLINACVRCDKIEEAWDLLAQMEESGVIPDNFTYSTLIKADYSQNDYRPNQKSYNLDRIFKLLDKIKERNQKPDEIVYNCLIDACIKHRDINRAVAVFNEMQLANIIPSSVTYGILIKAYGQSNQLENAFNAFLKMKDLNLQPNDVTYGCLLDACIRNNSLVRAEEVFKNMVKDNVHINTIMYTTMIKGYSKAHKLPEALSIYEKMKADKNNEPNSVTYNSLIDCCVRCDNMKKASSLFSEMKQRKVRPDLITFSTLIKGFCRDNSIEKAFKILKDMEEMKIKPDEVLFNSLLDGCCKANEIDLAMTVYKTMTDQKIVPSNVTFSILVKIYGKSKQLSKALGILDEMNKLNIQPGIVVYTCIIQTCIKAKQISTAIEKFEEMKKRKVQGDSVTYQTLLKGCIQFKKYEQGIRVLEDAVLNNVAITKEVSEPLFQGFYESNPEEAESLIPTLKDQLKRNRYGSRQNQHSKQPYDNKFPKRQHQKDSYNQNSNSVKTWNKENSSKNYWNKNKSDSNYSKNDGAAKPHWQSKPKNDRHNQPWRSKCISSNLNDFDLDNQEEEKTTELSSELVKITPIAVQDLNTTKKAFYPKETQENKKGLKKLNTSAKVWTPTEYKKPVEDKENNIMVNIENKENNQDNKMSKPKSYFNYKKSGLSDSQESSKKVLGDSSTHLTQKQENQNSYY